VPARPAALALVCLTSACSPAPPSRVPEEKPEPQAASARGEKAADEPDAAAQESPGDAGTEALDAGDASSAPVYQEPPPVVVHRHHVYCTTFARAGRRVTLTSLLSTASEGEPELGAGTAAVLQYKPKGVKDWVAVAKVKVLSITDKGSRVASSERREIAIEILSEEPGTKAAFVRSTKVRLEVDRLVEK